MKNIFLTLIFNFLIFISFSQDIIVDFSGTESSNSIDLSSVLVENETQNTSITLTGNFVLNLSQATVSEINSITDASGIKVYPNPFSGNSNFEVYSEFSENVEFSVYNSIGQLIFLKEIVLENGVNTFNFTSSNQGLNFISVKGEHLNFSEAFYCISASSEKSEIELISSKNDRKKSSTLFYNIGDKLKYTGYYGNMQTVITDSPETSTSYIFEFYICTDFNQNNYPVVKIGTQIWMAENLKSTHYANGTALLDGTSAGNIAGNYSSKYYFAYANNSSNVVIYGRLYTWAAVMNGAASTNNNPSGVQGICPSGWHVPSEAEWDEMRDFLGGWQLMHGKVKTVGTENWISPNSDATNESGLSVLPGGIRFDDGDFQYESEQGFFWNTYGDAEMHASSGYTFFSELPSESYYIYTFNLMPFGQSVRCVKN